MRCSKCRECGVSIVEAHPSTADSDSTVGAQSSPIAPPSSTSLGAALVPLLRYGCNIAMWQLIQWTRAGW